MQVLLFFLYGEIMYDDEMIRLQFALCAIQVGGAEKIRGPWHSNCNRKVADWDELADGRDTMNEHTRLADACCPLVATESIQMRKLDWSGQVVSRCGQMFLLDSVDSSLPSTIDSSLQSTDCHVSEQLACAVLL